MKKTFLKTAALLVAALPALALAQDSASGVSCPAGTQARQAKSASERSSAFCVKLGAGKDFGEPVLHGPFVEFHKNGKKALEGNYENGASNGRWAFYDDQGRLTGETEFLRGTYNGTRVEYRAPGVKKFEEHWDRGSLHGPSVKFDEKGQKLVEMQFEKGVLKQETKFKDGKPVQAAK
jgi:antitoxin component YwqK of YwqJK toxin-antitoxin module